MQTFGSRVSAFVAGILCLLAGWPVQAAGGQASSTSGGAYGLHDPLAGATVPGIIGGLIRYVTGFVGALFLLFFIYGGVLYLTAGGSGEQVKKAKHVIIRAVVGMMIIVFAYAAVTLILTFAAQVST